MSQRFGLIAMESGQDSAILERIFVLWFRVAVGYLNPDKEGLCHPTYRISEENVKKEVFIEVIKEQ